MPASLALTDLVEYTAWQRDQWQASLLEHPEALQLSTGPNGDGRFPNVGELMKHMFSAEKRYVERVIGAPLSDFTSLPADNLGTLFSLASDSRASLEQMIATLPDEAWDVPQEFKIMTFIVKATPRKIAAHILMHEIRHWAQISTICRYNGLACGFHDFLVSPVFGGEFRPE